MPGSVGGLGKAILPKDGKGPIRIGQNIDGVDMLAIAEQLKEATLSGVKKQRETLEKNEDVVVPAITALQTQVRSLRADAIALSNYLGAMPGIPNTFNDLQATVVKSGEYSQSAYVNATVDNTVAQATTNAVSIQVAQLASVDSRVTNTTTFATGIIDNSATPVTSLTTPLNIPTGNIYINGATIIIGPTDTLTSIAVAINSSQAGVQASIVPFGTNFNLILSGTQLATPITFTGPLGVTSPLATNFGIDTTHPTVITNLQANITYVVNDGVRGPVTQTYVSNSNTVTGLIPGVTLQLLNTTLNSGGTYDNLNISISNNTKEACDKILAFFQHYNDIREALNRNLMVDDEGKPLDKDASMVRSPLIRQLSEELATISNFTLVGAGIGDYTTCQDIGIVLDETATGFQKGTYTVTNAQTLLAAVNNNFEKVKKLFGNYATVSNSNFSVSSLGQSLSTSIAGQAITVTYSNVGGAYYASFSCGSISTGNIPQASPYLLVGPTDTAFQNITIEYSGATIFPGGSVTFSLTATQGMAATSAVELDQALNKETGVFTTELSRIKQQNEKLKAKVEKTEKNAERVEKKWIAQAARLDAERARCKEFSRLLDNMFNNDRK